MPKAAKKSPSSTDSVAQGYRAGGAKQEHAARQTVRAGAGSKKGRALAATPQQPADVNQYYKVGMRGGFANQDPPCVKVLTTAEVHLEREPDCKWIRYGQECSDRNAIKVFIDGYLRGRIAREHNVWLAQKTDQPLSYNISAWIDPLSDGRIVAGRDFQHMLDLVVRVEPIIEARVAHVTDHRGVKAEVGASSDSDDQGKPSVDAEVAAAVKKEEKV